MTARQSSSVAFRAALENHREQIESQLTSIAASAHEAVEKLALSTQQCPSDWSEWSLLDSEEFQDLKARVELLEAGSPGAPTSGATLAGEIADAAVGPLQVQLLENFEAYQRLEERASAHLQDLTGALDGRDVNCRSAIAYGPRARTILDEAERLEADVIVIRSHRVGDNEPRSGSGTLSYQVGILANCPVLLVK